MSRTIISSIFERILEMESKLDKYEEQFEVLNLRLDSVENRSKGFDFSTPIITPLPEDYPINDKPSKWDELYNNLVPCYINPVLLCHVTEQPELCVNCDKYNSSEESITK